MSLEQARKIADAVLYEGYLLYPYRASSSKNQVRWQYGIVGPAGGIEAGVGEETALHTECLVEPTGDGSEDSRVDVHLRFLQIQARVIEAAADGKSEEFTPVAELLVGSTTWITWDEAVEEEVVVPDLVLADLGAGRDVTVQIAGGEEIELLKDGETVVGRVVRKRWPLTGRLHISAASCDTARPLFLLHAGLTNDTAYDEAASAPSGSLRDGATRQSFVGSHLMIEAHRAQFVSVIDPPDWAAADAQRCANRRCWPVLMGDPGDRDIVLGSPIILYDHPQVAPESPGALYDSTEIDEILTLRIMTLTEEEKAAARSTDPRAAEIIDRSDLMPPEVFEKLHGALRGFGSLEEVAPVGKDVTEVELDATATTVEPPTAVTPDGVPWWGEDIEDSVSPDTDEVRIGDVAVSKGTRVRLRPSRRADAQDLFLADKTAVVSKVYSDVDGNTHVAVTLEDDPASEFHDWYGRYYYFGPEELEPLQPRKTSEASP
ncbi:MAG: hypothetical protein WCB04_13725 [Mycobacteriales bacterium]